MRKVGAALLALAMSSAASAGPILGLYNTGVSNNGATTSGQVAEPHWTMSVTGGTAPATAFNGGVNGNFPIGPWLADSMTSRWVTPSANAGASYDPFADGLYTFSLNFTLPGSAPQAARAAGTPAARFTGQFAVDNTVTGIRLNGNTITGSGGGFGSWTAFAANSGFLAGTNTLEFDVLNGAQNGGNPLGFRAEFLTSAVPESSTWAMMIGGFALIGTAMRRRRTLVARTA